MLDTIERKVRAPHPAQTGSGTRNYEAPLSREIIVGCVQAVDFIAVLLAGIISFSVYLVSVLGAPADFDRYSLTTFMGALLFLFLMRRTGSYAFRRLDLLGWQIGRIAGIWLATTSLLTTAAFLSKVAEAYSRGWAIAFALTALMEFVVIRGVLRLLIKRWKREGRLARFIGIVGAGEVGERLISKLKLAGQSEIQIAGVFDDRLTRVPSVIADCPVLGTTVDLVALAQSSRIDEIIIALPLRAADRISELVHRLRLLPVDIRLGIDSIAGAFPINGIGETASVPTINILDKPLKNWNGITKLIEDKVLSLVALAVFSPVMLLIAAAIVFDSEGPALFVQERFGFNNRSIKVLKFRTMFVDKGDLTGAARTVRGDPRVTRIGRFLRASSLDELPQFFNVLRGDMSLVGPRAHAIAMKAGDRLYHEAVGEYFQRHKVRPGITGWAQVNGLRGEIDSVLSAKQRVAYDLHYIDHWSLWFDLKIVVLTLRTVCARSNAY